MKRSRRVTLVGRSGSGFHASVKLDMLDAALDGELSHCLQAGLCGPPRRFATEAAIHRYGRRSERARTKSPPHLEEREDAAESHLPSAANR